MTDSNDKAPRSFTAAVNGILQSGDPAVLVTLISPPGIVGSKMIVAASEIHGSLQVDASVEGEITNYARVFLESREETRAVKVKEFASQFEAWAETKLLFERLQAEPRLVICGAGHVGAALARLGSMLGYRAALIDDRAEF